LNFKSAFKALTKIESLKILVLSNNQLTQLPKNIKKLSQIKGFVLDNNPELNIEKLLKLMKSLQKLQVLLLRNNELKKLPENLQVFSNLKLLELSDNNFSEEEKLRIQNALPKTKVTF